MKTTEFDEIYSLWGEVYQTIFCLIQRNDYSIIRDTTTEFVQNAIYEATEGITWDATSWQGATGDALMLLEQE